MALPKEPRQKMINIMYLVLTAILALNVSAEVINAFRTVDKSLRNSNDNIEKGNASLFNTLSAKLKASESAKDAAIWKPKADSAKMLSDALYNYIQGLKMDVKVQAQLKVDAAGNAILDEHGNEDFKEDYLEASTRVFESNKKGEELYNRLMKYKADMLGLDPEINAAFQNTFPVDMSIPPSHSGNARTGNTITDWTASYFHMTPSIAALTMLSKFQNAVKNGENQVVTFCDKKIGEVQVHLDKLAVLTGQSSNYLMPGQEITITAGVGAYSAAANPKITINGASANVVEGQGSSKFNVSGAGEHSVPISVTFTGENNKPVTQTTTVKYVVGTPGGAAVMLDKMNVFYIGVPNPITISSGSGWDKTSVSMSGGSLSGSNSNRVVTVSSPGTASITVTADGKSSKFDFRVKMIPDPVFKVASGKPRMPSVEFKNQQYCRAELEHFDFDTKFSVTGATVYFSGAGFPNVATSSINSNSLAPLAPFLSRCGPGSVVTFDNIRVTGPGGSRTIDGKSFALY